jgi:cytosine/adenosine deaminase-related metal-dependent hydrolase
LPPSPSETLDQFLGRIEATASRWHDPSDLAMTRVACAPTTPTFNVTPEQLPEIAQTARAKGLRLHAHLSENMGYVNFTLGQYGERPLPWLHKHGWTGPDVWYAHLVELDAAEVALMAETGTGMAHCPQANARLGSGIAPADALQALGGAVGFGVDGAGANEAADMGAAMYSAFALHRATKGVGAVQPEMVLHWATEGSAKVLGYERLGRIAPGMAADIAIFDITAPRNLGLHDPAVAPMVTGAAVAKHSFVAGRPVVKNGAIPGLDLLDLAETATSTVSRLKAGRAATLSALRQPAEA